MHKCLLTFIAFRAFVCLSNALGRLQIVCFELYSMEISY